MKKRKINMGPKTLRELLIEKAKEAEYYDGFELSEESLEEVLREDTLLVWEGDDSPHRWRIDYLCVCKIVDQGEERFFCYSACKGTNDNSWEDAGYHFEGIDEVTEVFPKEITTIDYVTKENL